MIDDSTYFTCPTCSSKAFREVCYGTYSFDVFIVTDTDGESPYVDAYGDVITEGETHFFECEACRGQFQINQLVKAEPETLPVVFPDELTEAFRLGAHEAFGDVGRTFHSDPTHPLSVAYDTGRSLARTSMGLDA